MRGVPIQSLLKVGGVGIITMHDEELPTIIYVISHTLRVTLHSVQPRLLTLLLEMGMPYYL